MTTKEFNNYLKYIAELEIGDINKTGDMIAPRIVVCERSGDCLTLPLAPRELEGMLDFNDKPTRQRMMKLAGVACAKHSKDVVAVYMISDAYMLKVSKEDEKKDPEKYRKYAEGGASIKDNPYRVEAIVVSGLKSTGESNIMVHTYKRAGDKILINDTPETCTLATKGVQNIETQNNLIALFYEGYREALFSKHAGSGASVAHD